MGFLFGSPKPPKPPPPPTVNDASVQQAAADARRRAVLARGRESTILTQGANGTKLGSVG